ncbi:histidine phosphatase family protein [Mesobacillus subterraneus]|uniref:Histidine phosphatase family protein n=1 Tax=Mesobacillus subterraneus TaxID=285983 RepID=A0A3R9F3B6_9BACI|nr:histidine phosphatase family protein [Mesobacillus subterraneus]RSD28948.1 hypothetical protein EJA10_02220 [Mesobacillus subterraneus]
MDDHVVITLFRHGLTEDNKRQAYLGWTDSPLVPGQVFPEVLVSYQQIYTSDLRRCRETAEALFPGRVPVKMEEFREMNFGEWEGRTYEQLKAKPLYQKWLADPFAAVPPHGESFSEFARRVESGWSKITREILENGIKTSAIVTHGGVIRYLLTQYGSEEKSFWDWRIPHGHGYDFIWKIEGLRRGERCTLLQEVPFMEKQNGSRSNIG